MRVEQPAFLGSLFLSRLADQMLLFLVPLVVFQVTQKATWSGLAFFVETVPRFIAFPICGALSDRVSPIRVLRVSQTSRAVACLIGIVGYVAWSGIGWLIALSAVCGALTSQGLVAREVLLPQIFPRQRFEKALAHTQLADQSGVVLGPIVAAALLGWRTWEWAVACAALLFVAADMAMFVWQRTSTARVAPPERAAGPWYAPFGVALTHVVTLPGLLRLVLLAAAENLVIGTTLATSAAMVTGTFRQSGGFYAGLQVAGAIATVAILLFVARIEVSRVRLGIVAFVAIAAGGLVMGTSGSIAMYVAGFLMVIGFDKMFNVYIRSARQAIIPPRDYGKTTGVIVLLNNATQPLAGLLVGLFSDHGRVALVVTLTSIGMAILGGALVAVGVVRTRSTARVPD
ncbi:MFS transporter [Burkholderia sp. MSMB1459WGS]|uniref:MFS transporter n=1 Tax=Burkholderia sp. MSMB1459WGS TaxID=1637970 RepID=UPI00075F8CF5|nr:MFS transporter [Burkholderia sp. MSMB1459WGS]KWO46137.1 MFS transporter [Burkholderia sp. MSMB1459WGS]